MVRYELSRELDDVAMFDFSADEFFAESWKKHCRRFRVSPPSSATLFDALVRAGDACRATSATDLELFNAAGKEGELPHPVCMPRRDDGSAGGFAARLAADHGLTDFLLKLKYAERWSPQIRRWVLARFSDLTRLVDLKLPMDFLSVTLYVGRFERTPFAVGIPKNVDSFTVVVEGKQTVRHWPGAFWVAGAGRRVWLGEPLSAFDDESATEDLAPGDMLYLPSNRARLTDYTDLSVAMTVSYHRPQGQTFESGVRKGVGALLRCQVPRRDQFPSQSIAAVCAREVQPPPAFDALQSQLDARIDSLTERAIINWVSVAATQPFPVGPAQREPIPISQDDSVTSSPDVPVVAIRLGDARIALAAGAMVDTVPATAQNQALAASLVAGLGTTRVADLLARCGFEGAHERAPACALLAKLVSSTALERTATAPAQTRGASDGRGASPAPSAAISFAAAPPKPVSGSSASWPEQKCLGKVDLATEEMLFDELVAAADAIRAGEVKTRHPFFRLYNQSGITLITDIDSPYGLPERRDGNTEGYAARLKEELGLDQFGLVLNLGECNLGLWERIIRVLSELVPDLAFKPAFDKILPVIFLGNYSHTPFGVHRNPSDTDHIFHYLATGKKTFYFWPSEVWEDGLEQRNWLGTHHRELLENALTYELTPGDIYYWPPDTYHIAETHGLSMSLALANSRPEGVAFNEAVFDRIDRAYIAGVKECPSRRGFGGSGFNRKPVEVAEHIPTALVSHLDEVRRNRKAIRADLTASWLRGATSRGFYTSPRGRAIESLRPTDRVSANEDVPLVLVTVDDKTVLVGAAGKVWALPNHPRIIGFVRKLQSAPDLFVWELLEDLAGDRASALSLLTEMAAYSALIVRTSDGHT